MPGEQTAATATHKPRSYLFRAQDLWLIFIAALIVTLPEANYNAYILLPLIGVFLILEPRVKLFSSRRGQVISIALKLILSYLLIGWTHTINSYYYPIFLIPVISAATTYEIVGVITVTAIACLAYFSFLLPFFVDWETLEPGEISLTALRSSFYAIVAFLVYEQAKAKRDEMKRTQEAAERLAESNRNLRQAEASLRRSERLAALGQLTAGLAHELRNPLGTIKASADMLTKQAAQNRPEIMAEMASYIGSETDRMNALITNFLDFARPLKSHPIRADLRAVVAAVTKRLADLIASRGVRLTVRINDDAASFDFDADLLNIAILNLAQNAVQASGPAQEVEIRAQSSGENVIIFVSDHGEGIQPQHLENIFNPFFTTKQHGVGLGLAIVAKIVDEHQGRINVFSEPGRGTTFEMTLPKVHGA